MGHSSSAHGGRASLSPIASWFPRRLNRVGYRLGNHQGRGGCQDERSQYHARRTAKTQCAGLSPASTGAPTAGIDTSYGANADGAVLSFQVDYQQPSPAPAHAPAGPLKVRGEWTDNPHINDNLDHFTQEDWRPSPASQPSILRIISLISRGKPCSRRWLQSSVCRRIQERERYESKRPRRYAARRLYRRTQYRKGQEPRAADDARPGRGCSRKHGDP